MQRCLCLVLLPLVMGLAVIRTILIATLVVTWGCAAPKEHDAQLVGRWRPTTNSTWACKFEISGQGAVIADREKPDPREKWNEQPFTWWTDGGGNLYIQHVDEDSKPAPLKMTYQIEQDRLSLSKPVLFGAGLTYRRRYTTK